MRMDRFRGQGEEVVDIIRQLIKEGNVRRLVVKNANEKVKDAIEYLIYRFRSDKKIDSIFKYSKHLKNINYIFKRVFK
mgnify:CR=1 FL=1